MVKILIDCLDWSEVWALFIPLAFYFSHIKKSDLLFPIQYYLFSALALNIFITLVSNTNFFYGRIASNHIFYNLLSITKVIFFGWFIKRNLPASSSYITKLIFIFYAGFILVNFSFFESPFIFSSRLLTTESIIIMFLGISCYLYSLQEEEKTTDKKQPVFLALTGLSIYEAVSFFIFLFYSKLILIKEDFAIVIWRVHNIAFIILCLFLAIAFQKSHIITPVKRSGSSLA